MVGDSSITILRRLIDAGLGQLPLEVAEAVFTQLRLPEADQSRMSELAAKCNQGSLSAAETVEYEGYVAAAELLTLLKAKARLSLQKKPSAA